MDKKNSELLTSLADFAKEQGINKSRLTYYASLGLFKPVAVMGVMGVYDRIYLVKILKQINSFKKQGKNLKYIIGHIKY